jgi:xanthine dehydrogenase YagR molybdenum-binding subunit
MNTHDYLKMAKGDIPQGKETPAAAPPEFKIVGKAIPRVDGKLIVTGRAQYTHDVFFKDMLYAKILRSPYAAAEVVAVDLSAAQSLPGVKAVLKLKEGRVKYEGEQIAAVAAVSEKIAEEAIKLIKVEYRPLPFVVTPDKAMADGAPMVHDSANVEKLNEYNRGNIDRGFAEAEVTFERTYKTAIEIHQPVETHASVAKWTEDELTVWDSTQAIFSVRDGLAGALGIPATRSGHQKYGGRFWEQAGVAAHVAAAKLAG